MDARNKKPGTAVARPTGRSQTRTAAQGKSQGRKNSRVACEGSAYLGTTGQQTTGSTTARGRLNETSLTTNKAPPKLRTSDLSAANFPVAKKDGFFTHKRGQGEYGSGARAGSTDRNTSLLGKQPVKTMEQLAKEGAAQAMMASGRLDTEDDDGTSELTFKNDTTAMSDVNSLQNFSYYGRRFHDRNQRQQESPVASDAVSIYNPKLVAASSTAGQGAVGMGTLKKQVSSNLGNTPTTTFNMSEANVSSLTGFHQRDIKTGGPAAEYQLEEKMNDNLMKQFQPMFSEEKSAANDNSLLNNSISDFSQLNLNVSSGAKMSRAELFRQAKETLMSQKGMQNTQPTTSSNNPQLNQQRTRSTKRTDSGSRAQTQTLTKTAQNFMPRKTGAKVLPPKLPPRATMSPAVSGLKNQNLGAKQQNLMASQGVISKPEVAESPIKDNMYFAHKFGSGAQGPASQEQPLHQPRREPNQTSEVLYKRGARSISKRRDSGVKNLIEQGKTEQQKSRREDYTSGSKKNLLTSDSKNSIGQNSEKRRESYVGKCRACQNNEIDGHDHSVSNSLDRRLKKFHQNFHQSGHCKQHNVMGCDRCSFGSSKGSRVSSLDSNNLFSGDLLKKHKLAPRSEISGAVNQQAKIARSVTRKMNSRQKMSGVRNSLQQTINQTLNEGNIGSTGQIHSRIRSLPRGDDDNDTSDLMDRFNDVRRSTKNAEVQSMTNKLIGYGKRGNRPSKNMLPKPGNFAISEVKVNVSGKGQDNTRNDSNDSRGYSEQYFGAKKIPQFSRILSANTSSVERMTLQNNLHQKDHEDLLHKDIKKLAEDWEGDPNDPEFWKRLENENSQTKLRKKEQLRGDSAKTKQLSVLGKQGEVFRQLKETDEMTSARGSQIGGFGPKASYGDGGHPSRQMMDLTRRSNQSFFNNTIMQGEPIQTEMDESTYHDATQVDMQRRLMQDPSRAVLTDYDIADEVGNLGFGSSIRHQIDFQDPNQTDRVALDTNIEDLKAAAAAQKQMKEQLQESKPPKQVDDMSSVHQNQQLFSGQTIKTQVVSSPMNLADIASAQQQSIDDQATGGFPSASGGKTSSQVDSGTAQPSRFENQEKDSEDADSFDEEKQKTQVMKALEDTEGEDEDAADGGDGKVDDDETEEERRRKKEIEQKTMANVIDYDEYLETQTQKEIERQSQLQKASPKSYLKDGMKLGEISLTQSRKSFEGLEDATIRDEVGLAESVRDDNLRNPRPKTRGEQLMKNLNQHSVSPTGDHLSSKMKQSNVNQFSARRKTHETSDSGTNYHLQKQQQPGGGGFAPNATQKPGGSPMMDYSSQLKSPDKRTLGFGGPSKIISEAGSKNLTNFASSLKDDDLMISSSMVDPNEKSMKATSKLGASTKTTKAKAGILQNVASADQLAIQEESSSLKTVSPLTENSLSKKSHQISTKSFAQSNRNSEVAQQPPKAPKPGHGLPPKDNSRPPKSPFAISSKQIAAENDRSTPDLAPKTTQVKSNIEDNYVSFAPDPANHKPEQQPSEVQASRIDHSDAKPALGERNPAVQAFLDFEDSDDDDFGSYVNKKPVVQNQSKTLPVDNNKVPENTTCEGELIKLSPQKQSNLAKTPSAQFVPNANFVRTNPHQMPQLQPFEQLPVQVAKTPNTGVSAKKLKAIQLENKLATAHIPPMPVASKESIEEPSVNEQIDRIDYNQSNDGMSASFYRHYDQQMQFQQQQQQHQTLRSQRSSRDSARNIVHKASGELPPEKATIGQQASKIVNEAAVANKKVQELRKSIQNLPPSGSSQAPPKPQRDSSLRQSGNYARPQGYVKKALNQSSRSNLNVRETSQDNRVEASNDTPDKFNRSSSLQRKPTFNQNKSVMSDSKGAGVGGGTSQGSGSGSKKQQFFAKHKDSISSDVAKTIGKKRESSEARQASRDRLYNQETIASILKRNPELGYNAKDKKPPAAPPRKPLRKKPVPLPPEPPKPDPPEEPLPQSPRVLQLPIEASVPNPECAPTTMPHPMRFPEDPPTEPSPFIMPNLFCPADPDTPYNYEIEPREEEFHFAPFEPVSLKMAIEPPEPEFPDRMIKSYQTDELYAEKLEEDEPMLRSLEPAHDDEPILDYPAQTPPFMLPPEMPLKFEECKTIYPDEPLLNPAIEMTEGCPTPAEPEMHYLTHDDLFKTNEISTQCENPNAVEESKEQAQHLHTIEEEPSDEDNFSVHSCEAVNKVTVGIQTNEAHFRNVTRTEEYARKKQERMESLDWALSPLFDEIEFAKEKKTIGGRKLMTSIGTQMESHENCGNQVQEEQIIQETAVQILSQIECEYNVDQLKRKMLGKDAVEDERCSELYNLGMNTLKALMLGLRLEKEWEYQTKHQYVQGVEVTDPDETIKLLTRCKKMYEAKTLIQRLLKMIVQRNQMVEEATKLEESGGNGGDPNANISLKKPQPQPKISKESLAQINRLSTRVTSQINTLQEEHRIFKRPFILKGQEYLQQIQSEGEMLEQLMAKKFFVDERGTTGEAARPDSAMRK